MNRAKVLAVVAIIGSTAVAIQSCQGGGNDSDSESTANRADEHTQTSSGSSASVSSPTPRIVERETVWHARWFTLAGDMKRGGDVGTQMFPSTFAFNWGDGIVYGNYNDFVAFSADAKIYAHRSGLFNFTVGADDGMQLSIDGQLVIDDQWNGGGSFARKTVTFPLTKGLHRLNLQYYERSGGAAASFDCDHELLTWHETIAN